MDIYNLPQLFINFIFTISTVLHLEPNSSIAATSKKTIQHMNISQTLMNFVVAVKRNCKSIEPGLFEL